MCPLIQGQSDAVSLRELAKRKRTTAAAPDAGPSESKKRQQLIPPLQPPGHGPSASVASQARPPRHQARLKVPSGANWHGTCGTAAATTQTERQLNSTQMYWDPAGHEPSTKRHHPQTSALPRRPQQSGIPETATPLPKAALNVAVQACLAPCEGCSMHEAPASGTAIGRDAAAQQLDNERSLDGEASKNVSGVHGKSLACQTQQGQQHGPGMAASTRTMPLSPRQVAHAERIALMMANAGTLPGKLRSLTVPAWPSPSPANRPGTPSGSAPSDSSSAAANPQRSPLKPSSEPVHPRPDLPPSSVQWSWHPGAAGLTESSQQLGRVNIPLAGMSARVAAPSPRALPLPGPRLETRGWVARMAQQRACDIGPVQDAETRNQTRQWQQDSGGKKSSVAMDESQKVGPAMHIMCMTLHASQ